VGGIDHQQIVAETLAKHLEELRGRSLIEKLRALIAVIKPPPEVFRDKEYRDFTPRRLSSGRCVPRISMTSSRRMALTGRVTRLSAFYLSFPPTSLTVRLCSRRNFSR
jgi:hypothetical protein